MPVGILPEAAAGEFSQEAQPKKVKAHNRYLVSGGVDRQSTNACTYSIFPTFVDTTNVAYHTSS